MKKRIVSVLALVVCITSVLISCNDQKVDETNVSKKIEIEQLEKDKGKDKDKNGNEDTSKEIHVENESKSEHIKEDDNNNEKEDLQKYFNENKSYLISNSEVIKYTGYAEHGFAINYDGENKDGLIINYNGKMEDGYGEDERGERSFKLEYYFHSDSKGVPMAYERIRNNDYMNLQKDNLVSIIKNYIVMWGDIEIGKEWTQNVSIDGEKYTAKTTVTDVQGDSYKLNTVINDIEGYSDKTYKEERVYTKGKGLVNISCSTKSSEGDFLIGYTLVE